MPGALHGLFWYAVAHIAYAYAGFPLLAFARARLAPRPAAAAPITPHLAVVIAAHDEEAAISDKVDSVLAAEYPSDRLHVVVASDGSTDGTVTRAARPDDARVTVLDLPRGGKAATLNRAVAGLPAEIEIIVMSDATSLLDPAALAAIVRPFADPAVGAVAGDQRYRTSGSDASGGERSYWSFDRRLKAAESASGSAIGATGALYAIRRSLYRPIPGHVNDDFFCSASVVGDGYRLVFEPDAIAYEPPAATVGGEFRRKVRVITRALYTEIELRHLANPMRTGFYAVTFLSHKVLRHLVVVPLGILAIVTVPLAGRSPLFALAAVGQLVAYGLGAAGMLLSGTRVGRHRTLALPAFFLFANAASLVAAWNVVRGQRIERWGTGRE